MIDNADGNERQTALEDYHKEISRAFGEQGEKQV
jgi:hypothetical protein